MKVPPVKGTRDFYPAEMAVRNWIIDGWKRVSLRNGFEEYDGPIFEYLSMYQIKSGQEIVSQLFSFEDRGGRALAIRPEITPTLARMVNQRINSLPRPIKWFSVPRLCRAERPQKGRLREFFQWNVDVIGIDDVLADAEAIFCAVDYLREAGLSAQDVVVRISSRKALASILEASGVRHELLEPLYAVLDKRAKIDPEAFDRMMAELIEDSHVRDRINELMNVDSVDRLKGLPGLDAAAGAAVDELARLFDLLEAMGIGDFCAFDVGIVRGLAYYTGIVYEIYDRGNQLRAIGGGGRYDDLLGQFGGPAIPATGFGMGDCVLGILLEEKALIQKQLPARRLDYFVAWVEDAYRTQGVGLAARLRSAGYSANFSYKPASLSKQIRFASQQGAQNCVIIGDEFRQGKLIVKDMADGRQELVRLDEFLKKLNRDAG